MVFAKISTKTTGNILIGCCYRPPNNNMEYAKSMTTSLKALMDKNPTASVWIGGDLNLPDVQWKDNTSTCIHNTKSINEEFMSAFQDYNVKQLVDFPTRKENTLDLFLTNPPSLVNRLEPMPGISDHDTIIYVDTSVRPYRHRPPKRKLILWKNADLEKIRNMADTLTQDILSQNTTQTPINTLWTKFKEGVENITDTIPTKMTSTRFNKPWINRSIKKIYRQKQRAYNKAKTSKSANDWSRFKKLQKLQRVTCRNAYNSYVREIISPDINERPKRFWSFIKSKCDNNGVAPLRGTDGLIYSDPEKKAEILNKQFTSVFTREPSTNLPDLGPSSHPVMDPINITVAGVVKLLKNIKQHKATGPDNIQARILKETAANLGPALTLIFQAPLAQATLPDEWKSAHVAPIFKKGDRCQAANYRPVSLTCISCKIMEHIISSSLMRHLDAGKILTDAQHGFRKRCSCETQLISTVQDFIKGIDDTKQTDVILLDFSKAFDKVPHLRLLKKLHHYGVQGSTQKWIASFLNGRSQKVQLSGPILFLVYINDLPECVQSSTKLFADDCVLYRTINSRLLQEDLNSLQMWEDRWMMSFHPDKCQTLRITNKRKITEQDYHIHGHKLELVDSAKYLGVHLHRKLSWSPHVATTARKADNTRAFLQRNIRACPKKIREQCYTTLVRPILEYSSPVWDPHSQKDIDTLEKVQRHCARFVHQDFSRESSVTKMLNKLNWDSLAERRAKAKVTMIYRGLNGLVDIAILDYLKPATTNTRGHDKKFFIPFCRTTTMRHSFFYDTTRHVCGTAFHQSPPQPRP